MKTENKIIKTIDNIMAKKLDNIKMWEKILCYMDDYTGSHINPAGVIKQALKDQGFKFDGEHIVPINPEPLKIEKGKCYTEEEIAAQSYNPFDDFRKSDTEKSEPKQENSDVELTEFEKLLVTIGQGLVGISPEDYKSHCECWATTHSKKLLDLARKAIASEIDTWRIMADFEKNCADFDKTGIPMWQSKCAGYRQGIQDTKKLIEKGE